MRVNLNGTEYRIYFQHFQNRELVGRNGPFDLRASTLCNIVGPDDILVASGMASCHPHDQFKKETGRKLALKRALEVPWGVAVTGFKIKAWILTREQRTEIWRAYHARSKNRGMTKEAE